MTMQIDDGKLRARHRMLRDDERRTGLVLADVWGRNLGLASLGRPRPDLAGWLLCAGKGTGEGERRENGPEAYRHGLKNIAASRKPNSVGFVSPRRRLSAPPRSHITRRSFL